MDGLVSMAATHGKLDRGVGGSRVVDAVIHMDPADAVLRRVHPECQNRDRAAGASALTKLSGRLKLKRSASRRLASWKVW